jgi:hypothetical protein
MNSIIKMLLLSAVSAGALFAFAGTAAASHAMLEVKAVGPLTVGERSTFGRTCTPSIPANPSSARR